MAKRIWLVWTAATALAWSGASPATLAKPGDLPVEPTPDLVAGDRVHAAHAVDDVDDLVAHGERVDVAERLRVRHPVAGDHDVADVARERGARPVTGPAVDGPQRVFGNQAPLSPL